MKNAVDKVAFNAKLVKWKMQWTK